MREEGLLQIGEVAAICGISRKMILNYEKHGLLKPTLVDFSSGYRYYNTIDVARVQLILNLRYCGMSISDIGNYLNGTLDMDEQISQLEGKRRQIDKSIRNLRRRRVSKDSFYIEIIDVDEQYCIKKDVVVDNIHEGLVEFSKQYHDCIEKGIVFAPNSYHFSEYTKNISDDDFFEYDKLHMSICICVDKASAPPDAFVYPAGRAVTTNWNGKISESYKAYMAIQDYINRYSLVVRGFPCELYLEGGVSAAEKDNFMIQIIVPIEDERHKKIYRSRL